ncbi:DUF2283 domain-containing protein [Terrilactibacillus sp. S3-3]|nr:DUF2283 domain-containing protein [Terrilactibacillus sp. S3-3]
MITFDKEAELAYVYVVPPSMPRTIKDTEDLEVNDYIALDIDKFDRIVGLEFCDEIAMKLKKKKNGERKIYKRAEHSEVFQFRLSADKVVKKFRFKESIFVFQTKNIITLSVSILSI